MSLRRPSLTTRSALLRRPDLLDRHDGGDDAEDDEDETEARVHHAGEPEQHKRDEA